MKYLDCTKEHISHLEIDLWRKGAGQPLLFLHPGDGLDFQAPVLDALTEKFEVFAPSHPGFDKSATNEDYDSVDNLSYFYLEFLKHFDLRDVLVVGISLGAWIAAEIAVKCTHRMVGMVLSGALGVKFQGARTREIADLFSIPQYDHWQWLYADGREFRSDEWSDDFLGKLARNQATFGLIGWSPTLYSRTLARHLHRIDVPVLVLHGDQDRVVSADYGQSMAAAIPDATFRSLAGGHYAHLEDTDTFLAEIDTFAAGIASRSSD